jgi:hypothetical protein
MNRDEEAKNLRLYDKRIVERNIKKGLITRKDQEKFLKALPDAADKVIPPEERIDEGPDDDDGPDLDDEPINHAS